MREMARVLQDAIHADLKAGGHLPLDFYPSLVRDDDPASGFAREVYPPRFSQTYWGLRHRLAVLVETHSWKDYRTRVLTTHDVLLAALRAVQSHGASWRVRMRGLDEDTARSPPRRLDLAFVAGPETETLEFPAYAYDRVPVAGHGRNVPPLPSRPPGDVADSAPEPRRAVGLGRASGRWMGGGTRLGRGG